MTHLFYALAGLQPISLDLQDLREDCHHLQALQLALELCPWGVSLERGRHCQYAPDSVFARGLCKAWSAAAGPVHCALEVASTEDKLLRAGLVTVRPAWKPQAQRVRGFERQAAEKASPKSPSQMLSPR